MSNSLVAFSSDYSVAFSTKKGMAALSIEGAIHKGGAALVALRDVAVDSAVAKALIGRYSAAVDIISVAFPKVASATYSLVGSPSANKSNFATFLNGIDRVVEPAKGFSKKQIAARQMAQSLRVALGMVEAQESRTVDMVA
jgi:hypothetical protein